MLRRLFHCRHAWSNELFVRILGWIVKLPRFIVLPYFLLQTLGILAVTCYLITREEMLSLVFKRFHQSLSLRVRVESHRGSNLVILTAWSHDPGLLFRYVWSMVNEAILLCGGLNSISVAPCCSKIHALRPHHLGCVAHLLETLSVIVSFSHRPNSHVLDKTSHSAAVIAHKTFTLGLYTNTYVMNGKIESLTRDASAFDHLLGNFFGPFFLQSRVLL